MQGSLRGRASPPIGELVVANENDRVVVAADALGEHDPRRNQSRSAVATGVANDDGVSNQCSLTRPPDAFTSSSALWPLSLPSLFAQSGASAARFVEFFTANVRNVNTRKAYYRAVREFAHWCQQNGLRELRHIEPVHIAAYIEGLQARIAAPSVNAQLAALRGLFDWFVMGQVIAVNPASSVRGPKHAVKKGKTPVLTAQEARSLLDSIDATTTIGLRDRAIIALMLFTFARIGAALRMQVQDVYVQGGRTWVRLYEKGGKRHEMPCHHKLDGYLRGYLERSAAAGDQKEYLFRTVLARTGQLTRRAMTQADAHQMVRRRAASAGISTKIGNHSFRATGITEYLRNGGRLEIAQQMANHECVRTTSLYDRRNEVVPLDEIERIVI